MKKITRTFAFISLLFSHLILLSQNNTFPEINLQTLEGDIVSAADVLKPDKALLLVFFKTYDKKACENLFSIHDAFYENLSDKNVKLIAICNDQAGAITHLKPFVYGHDLQLDVYIDPLGEFRNNLGVNAPAFTILYDRHLKEYCRHSGFCPGNDEMMCEKVIKCLQNID